ncbi:hypothetical protein ACILE2_03780 [Capnocytophaga canimorsus]|uniref:hypothetical protein n=1 Tax=Capnocytophaga canimorsus TaxID=28188 RepID=UPI0037D56428
MKSKLRLILKPFLIISLLFALQGCFSVKPGKTGNGKKLYETFYAGEEGNQYFIKPFELTDLARNEKSLWDFSFRSKVSLQGESRVNFSLFTQLAVHKIEKVSFSNKNTNFSNEQVSFMFIEKTKEGFLSRFTLNTDTENLKALFSDANWEITIKTEQGDYTYTPDKAVIKKINTLDQTLFVLFYKQYDK